MSGGGNIYTEWNMYMDQMIEQDESYRLICVLAKLGVIEKEEMYDMRDKVLSGIFGIWS